MTRRRTATPVVALATTVVLALAGCGGDDDDLFGADDTTTTVAEQTTVAPETTSESTTASTDATTTDAATATTAAATSAPPAPPTSPVPTAGAATTGPSPSSVPAATGFVFTSPDGSYTVTYPSEPVSQTVQAPLPGGESLPVDFFVVQEGPVGYVSSMITYDEGVQASLDGAVQGAIANSGAELVSDEAIELAGRSGRQFVGNIGAGTATIIARVFADGNRLWQVIYTGAGELSPDDPAAAAFLDSFQFTEGG